ncbi:MAG: polynucleotide adenylyltransferase [Candidatus Atribacteria bacterium]
MSKKEENQKLNLKIEAKDIDAVALFIIKRLNNFGFSAFVVGGCIRNLVMRQEANDWDIATKARPDEISQAFRDFKVVPVGRKFGTVTVVINHINYQVSAFKSAKSACTSNLFEDLRHRDFTINALAWGEKERVLDYLNGLEDIRKRTIRCVEDPAERIKEDPLRMLRAVRLACELDFKIDKATPQAIKENSPLIKEVSSERIRDELIKILISNFPKRGIKLLQQLGLLQQILPELEKCIGFYQEDFYQEKDLFEYITNLLNKLPSNLVLRLAALLGEVTRPLSDSQTSRKEVAVKILRRLRFKKAIIKQVSVLVQEDWRVIDFLNPKNIRQLISKVGKENIQNVLKLKKADIKIGKKIAKLKQLEKIEQKVREVLKEKPPVSLKDLAINGKDLINLGCKEGKELGAILRKMLRRVIDRPELNKREILLEFLKSDNSNFLGRGK